MQYTYKNIPSLRKYVLTQEKKDAVELDRIGREWARVSEENKLSYEIEWLGVPIIQTPEDLILIQEVILKVQPDVILEVGIAHGGGLIFSASLLELLGRGKVIGVDLEIRVHNRDVIEHHPLAHRIELIEGNSCDQHTVDMLKNLIACNDRVVVFLDSNHTKSHVLTELHLYQQFVDVGSYIVVFDTISSELAKVGAAPELFIDNGPGEAVAEFLSSTNEFEIDSVYNKFASSHNTNGFLRRI